MERSWKDFNPVVSLKRERTSTCSKLCSWERDYIESIQRVVEDTVCQQWSIVYGCLWSRKGIRSHNTTSSWIMSISSLSRWNHNRYQLQAWIFIAQLSEVSANKQQILYAKLHSYSTFDIVFTVIFIAMLIIFIVTEYTIQFLHLHFHGTPPMVREWL